MRKKLVGLLSLVLLCGSLGAVAQQPDMFSDSRGEIVFVNLERVFNEFYKTQLAKSRMELQKKDVEIEKQLLVDEMTFISEEVDVLKKEARDNTLPVEIRNSKRLLYEDRLIELREKQKEGEEFSARRQKQMQVQVTRMSQKIMDEIRRAIVDYSKQEGLMAVLDSSNRNSAVGVFLYTHQDVDISNQILQALNSERPDNLEFENLFEDDEEKPEAPPEES
jgi:Skp family chaperone for outer membrane proteins